ncbi:hypothetical protein A3A67_01885 [Candidatus Peribacteria bacterium RIFCSPLOWO2_01_FULL_51_18]|nr:MAG: hypothetical protein A3C52_05305 [Candidatus Peribacteria bacterium RIFCSPHIGHO2_02_FULL_51_15]OGJ66328.1 MAG: hypothetical protein A3A67_01885 [Candidatus Peribacteria bacterium RIFCSPLOWO2_01_FULL_51_18]
MIWYFAFFAALGLVLGSFGNVVIVRVANSERLTGRSHCVACLKKIPWYDLFPVLSWLFLSGRCRFCRRHISVRYPLVEIVSALIFVAAFAWYPEDFSRALITGVLITVLFFTCVFDALYQRLPDIFTIIIGFFALALVGIKGDFKSALIGAAIPAVWFAVQWLLSRGRWVGSGDVFLGAALGLWLGHAGSITMLVLSYITGALTVTAFLLTGKITPGQKRISFAPFLGIGAVLAWLGIGEMYLALLK